MATSESVTERNRRLSHITIADGPSGWQKLVLITGALLFAISLIINTALTLSVIVLGLITTFFIIVTVKFALSLFSGRGLVYPDHMLSDRECPDVTVKVAMYNESEVIGQLVRNLRRLDYPPTRLWPILILEEDDLNTQSALGGCQLPDNFQVVIVPLSYMPEVRGKPRALEYVRRHCPEKVHGDIIGVYDAEDRPERQQVRMVASVLNQHPGLCGVQAELRWRNAFQNWKTACLAFNYAMHYQLVLPGLMATHGVMPLGGTSNFIRRHALDSVGGWDPAHVAEDQDLGVKLRRAGYHMRMIPSVTWEEALPTVTRQAHQASRWTKGGIATTISHTRDLRPFWRDHGWWGSLTFFTTIAAAHPAALAAPLFWVLTVSYAITRTALVQQVTPAPAFYLGTVCLLANYFFLFKGVFAAIKSDQPKLLMYVPFLPIHWMVVGSQAAYIAAFEALTGKMSYWRKTPHGLVEVPVEVPEGEPAVSV